MSSKSSFSNTTARSYAVALYELSKENSELVKVEEGVKSLKGLLNESLNFKEMISSPTIAKEDKKNVTDIIGKNSPIITTLARVEERKGHMFILNALPKVKEKFPNVLYLIAGKGPYLETIKQITKKMNLVKNVKFLGWITEPEKSLILKQSDLFVMTPTTVGESVEGFGMAYIDASFHGVASIGSDSGGVSDAILDNVTGIICEAGNQKMITEKILLLLENKKLRESMGTNGKLRANENYAWDKKIIEYLDASK